MGFLATQRKNPFDVEEDVRAKGRILDDSVPVRRYRNGDEGKDPGHFTGISSGVAGPQKKMTATPV